MATRKPTPAYQDTGVLYGDKELYTQIGKIAEGDGGKKLGLVTPYRDGRMTLREFISAWVKGSSAVFEDGVRIPRRMRFTMLIKRRKVAA